MTPTGSSVASAASPSAPPGSLSVSAQRVYSHVKAAILEQVYEGGSLLTETEIAEAVGVSRTPVREALLRLAAEELLRLYPKKGALVLPMSARDVEDILEARLLVEGHAAARIWERRSSLLADLGSLLETMQAAVDAGDPRALMAADRAFHERVVEAAGNAVLTRFYAGLRDRQQLMGVAVMRVSPERMSRALAEHRGLVAALAGDDPDAFRQLALDHVGTAAAQVRSLS
ncbi:MAG: GntR family transcriptional regulator [Actinomycetales bacterium]